jgi:nitrate reductase alpha subunit
VGDLVKDGIITWEMQQTDYPLLEPNLPPYEPRRNELGLAIQSQFRYSATRNDTR